MTDLGDLFDRATDGIASPSLAVVALETARRRRTRRRGAVAAVLASGVVVTVVVATQLGGGTSAGPAPSTSTPTSLPADPAPVDEQPEWDPRTVDDLPASDLSVAPALPETIDPPGTAPDLADSPVAAAVLAVELEGTVMLLGTDGSWRSLVVAAPDPRVVLSPSGTRVAVYHYADTGAGVTIRDLATGAVAQWPYPEGYQPWDFTSWSFTDDDTLLLDDGAGGFLLDVTSGSAERVPYPATAETSSALDDAGAVLESSALGAPPTLTDWADGTARTVPTDRTGPLRSIEADSGSVVGLTQLQRLAVVVADRRTLAPRTLLPVRNPEDNYGKGGLGVVALADDGTVLLQVAAYGRRAYEGFRVVAWDPRDGDLSLVSSTALPAEASVVFADALVRRTAPELDTGPGPTVDAPPIDPAVVQPLWDPATVTDLPWTDDPRYPRSLAPADGLDDPAVASPMLTAVGTGSSIETWHANGERSARTNPETPYDQGFADYVALSPDGAWLAFAGRTSLWVSDEVGRWSRRPYPEGFRTAPDFGVSVTADLAGGVYLQQYGGTWYVDPDGRGTALRDGLSDIAAALDGTALVATFDEATRGRSVLELDGATVRTETGSGELQSLVGLAASERSLAAARGVGGVSAERDPVEQNGLVALERDGLVARAYLPVRLETDGGALQARAWLDDDHVLAAVVSQGTRHLFSWNITTGDLRRVSDLPSSLPLTVASAPGGDS